MPALAEKDERRVSYGRKTLSGGSFNDLLRLGRVTTTADIPGRTSPVAWLARRQARATFW